MIRKMIRQMLSAQVISALTVSLCLLIDSVVIGQFLGEDAVAAYGLASPLLLAVGAAGTLLAAGVQVVCSKALGKGSQEEANAGYSSAISLLAATVVFPVAVVLLRSVLARVLGAGSSGVVFEHTRGYLAGFSIGAPGSVAALVLIPFLQMAGQSNLLIAAVLTMTVADVALDLLNVLVIKGGMFGIGLASALSYYFALAVVLFYFLSKKCVFRFSRKLVTRKMILNLLSGGIPAGVNMLSSVILVFIMNRMLQTLDGKAAVAAYSVIQSIGNAANCITTGIGGVSLTVCGIFYHEEDKTALRETLRQLCRWAVVLGAAVGVLLLIFAPALVSLFIPKTGKAQEMAVLGLRLFAAGLIPCCINNALKYAYQASEKAGLTEAICLLEGTFFPAAAAYALSRFMHTTGAWLGFAAGEALTLLAIGLMIRRISGKMPWRDGACLLLKEDFGAPPDQILERDISSVDEVTTAAEAAGAFCREHGGDARISNHIALCVEEAAGNVIQHGFSQDRKAHHLSLRMLNKPDHWVLRFRDDCKAFDPVHFTPKEEEQALGIRLVMKLAEEATYTNSVNLNNLALKLRKE